MDARMREHVAAVQAERDQALADRDRLMALVERLTAEQVKPFWSGWFGRGRK